MAHDVFISYSARDKVTADAACARLEAAGIRCWIAPRDVLPGANWAGAIIQAIHESRALVLVFSADANHSPQVTREVERAVSGAIPIIPFRIEDVVPSEAMEYYLGSHHWLDAMTPPLHHHLERLATTLHLLLEQGSAPEAESGTARTAPAPDVAPTGRAAGDASRTSSGPPPSAMLGRRKWLTAGGIGVAGVAAAILLVLAARQGLNQRRPDAGSRVAAAPAIASAPSAPPNVRATVTSVPSAIGGTSGAGTGPTGSAAPRQRLGGLDFGGYCRSLGYLSVILDGQTIDDWHCRVSINTTAVCQMQYNSDAVARYTNLNDPLSWGCYVLSGGQNAYLGGMDLNKYCQSQRYIGVRLDGNTINDWHCQFSINASAACQWQYKRADASASFSNLNDPNSWSCFVASPSPQPR